MMRKPAIRTLVLALPLYVSASAATAVSESSLDDQADGAKPNASVPSIWSEPTTTVVEVTIPPSTPGAPAAERPLSANPLWGTSVKQFSVTRERPIFLPSRRPPAPPPSAITVAKVASPPKPKEPEQPQLSLVGTISGDDAKFGIFIDQATNAVVRLKLGEDFQGWQLRSVQGRGVAFQKNQQSFVVSLPQPGFSQASIAVREEPGDTRLVPVNVGERRGRRQ
jgi:general secretion pathway protein N